MPRQHRSSATTPCSNSCQSVSCISQAREYRTTSPTRQSGSAFPIGKSAAREPPSTCTSSKYAELARDQLPLAPIARWTFHRGGGGRDCHACLAFSQHTRDRPV